MCLRHPLSTVLHSTFQQQVAVCSAECIPITLQWILAIMDPTTDMAKCYTITYYGLDLLWAFVS